MGSTVVVILAYVSSVFIKPPGSSQAQQVQVAPTTQPLPITDNSSTGTSSSSSIPPSSSASAQSGSYSDTVSYFVHGNNEQIAVTMKLNNSVVDSLSVTDSKSDPMSDAMQTSFENSINDLVVGKNINDINLASVGGASFTTAAFMEAVNKIKNTL